MTNQTLSQHKPAKWAYAYIVQAHQRHGDQLRPHVVTFMFRDTAERFAKATHGTLWLMSDVSDYTPTYLAVKADREPIRKY